jgi:UrcA family protein
MLNSHRSIVRTLAVIALAGAPSLLLADLATAAVVGEAAPSVTVRYHDLNLNSPAGIAGLYARIRGAAGEVCRTLESRDFERKSYWDVCFNHAVADAVKQVHNRTLSAYHWQRIRGWKTPRDRDPTTLASQ